MKTLIKSLGRLFSPSSSDAPANVLWDGGDMDPCLGIDSRLEQALLASLHSDGARQYLDYVCRGR
ncbi:hypothetical protein [Defluviimonas sp. WL0075]|uniref:Uncharacterized protein n=1 Tax=Albidovulum sediminicola TaxID=2984331 RepID=A0ABT2Z132_9RHOB|nr:hypothetical protein [Defluviimonas sp. WL0075]MCV2864807.1 hypothetical protein [Defluviimonas sp. WL0075]